MHSRFEHILIATLIFLLNSCYQKQESCTKSADFETTDSVLTVRLNKLTGDKKAQVGVGIIYDGHEYSFNNVCRYPIMSVYKLPIALAVLHKAETANISLDSIFTIEPALMKTGTYSPLRDKYPDQTIQVTLREIIRYTVSQSDNNTCDWLITFAEGIDSVDRYIRSLGLSDFKYHFTEDKMHQNMLHCYDNWSTPLEMSRLLYILYNDTLLGEANFTFLKETLHQTTSGQDKLIAGLPSGIRLEHKTGHSDRLHDGTQIGECDAGVVYLPDNRKLYITVFVKDSHETDSINAAIIANVARIAYATLSGLHK